MMILEQIQALEAIVDHPVLHQHNNVQIKEAFYALEEALQAKRKIINEHNEELSTIDKKQLSKDAFLSSFSETLALQLISRQTGVDPQILKAWLYLSPEDQQTCITNSKGIVGQVNQLMMTMTSPNSPTVMKLNVSTSQKE